MKIKFCGASTGVTGSCHLLTSGEHKILLDCGQFQGGKAQDALNYERFPFEPSEIECVVLSHAHIDHCGRLPLLTKRGFEGKIYCTDATADLLSIMLKDSAYIHEKETEWKNRKAERAGRNQVEPLYTIEDAEKALSLVSPILYDQQIEINPNMKIVFNDAGHILGSAITELWVTEDDKESKIVFSGDLGMEGRPILRDPTYIKKADYVIMETTYGNRIHKELGSGVEKLIEIILNTTRRGGNVVIPSFAVGRTQELIYELNRFYDSNNEFRKELDKIFVYVDSPMATTATDIFRRNAQVFDEETREYSLKGDNPLEFKNLKFTRSSKESQDLNFNKEPKVIISASGMCEAGRIRHHLKHNLWNPKNSIVFVGYQGQGTLGRSLIEGIKMVTLFGEEIQNGLFAWLAHFQQKPKEIFLVHGEEDSKKDFAKLVNEKLSYEPVVVMGNSEFDLDMNKSEITNMEGASYQAAEEEKIQKVRDKLSSIHLDLEQILYSANLAVEGSISDKKINTINNIIQELEKSTINLATAVNENDEHRENE